MADELDDVARMAWNLDGNAANLNDYIRAFRAGYEYCRQQLFAEQRAIRERENESRRTIRNLKKETTSYYPHSED